MGITPSFEKFELILEEVTFLDTGDVIMIGVIRMMVCAAFRVNLIAGGVKGGPCGTGGKVCIFASAFVSTDAATGAFTTVAI